MNRWDLRRVNQKVLAKEKLSQFYTSYKYQIDELLEFADTNIKARLSEIENFFAADLGDNRREAKKKRFDVPLSYAGYVELRSRRSRLIFFRNREFHRALKRVGNIYQRQWFRNLEIFSMMEKCLDAYRFIFKRNQHLSILCRIDGYVGLQSKMFRRRRMEESKILLSEFRRIRKGVRREVCINRVEDYIRMYSDFFVQCQFKLDKFNEGINRFLLEENSEKLKNISMEESEEVTDDLELPGWNLVSK